MTILKMLDLSTSHVSKETAQTLDEAPDGTINAYQKDEYGWFVWVPPTEWERADQPADLLAAFAYARTQQCDWIMFDRDAEIIDDLPSFDW